MKIIIDIPEEEYKECKNRFNMIYQEGYLNYNLNTALTLYVANGTPLPKNHGRLIECERLQESFRRNVVDVVGYENYKHLFDIAPTIIEAESEEEE